MSGAAALVAGFTDPAGVVAGACWRLGDEAGGVLLAADAVSPAKVDFAEESGDHLGLSLSAGEASGELAIRLGAVHGDGVSCAAADADVELELGGKKRSLTCPGSWLSWEQDPRRDASVVRQLAMPTGEDVTVLLAARRPAGLAGHGEEEVSGFRATREQVEPYREALLSTQYDGQGRPTRIGLELWLGEGEETHPTRAAATVIGTVTDGDVTAAMLRTSAEGNEGVGSYLVWRR